LVPPPLRGAGGRQADEPAQLRHLRSDPVSVSGRPSRTDEGAPPGALILFRASKSGFSLRHAGCTKQAVRTSPPRNPSASPGETHRVHPDRPTPRPGLPRLVLAFAWGAAA